MPVTATYRPIANPLACADTYEELRPLIYATVSKFKNRYGGDFDEMLAEANLRFALTYEKNQRDPSWFANRGVPFGAALQRHIWNTLFDAYRVKARRHRIGPALSIDTGGKDLESGARDKIDLPDHRTPSDYNWLAEFATRLAEDAAICLRLIFDAPPEVAVEAEAKGGTPRNIRSTVRAALARQGWDRDRIVGAFEEIESALAKG